MNPDVVLFAVSVVAIVVFVWLDRNTANPILEAIALLAVLAAIVGAAFAGWQIFLSAR